MNKEQKKKWLAAKSDFTAAGAEYFRSGLDREALVVREFPYFMPFVKSGDLSTPQQRLCDRLWNEARKVSYFDVHTGKDGKTFERRDEDSFDPQFERITNASGKKSVAENVPHARVCDAIIQRNLETGEYVPVSKWIKVNGDYVNYKGCRFEFLNIKLKYKTAKILKDGKVAVSNIRTEVCSGRAVSESMSLIDEEMLNLAFIQETAFNTDGAGWKAYVVYAFNYGQVREHKDAGESKFKDFGDLKHGESIYRKKDQRLYFKLRPFLKVNLDKVQFGFDAQCIHINDKDVVALKKKKITLV
jgi:hypothetical protein